MTIKIAIDNKKPKFGRKIQSEFYLPLPLCINRSITKNFLIKTISEMIDSTCLRFFILEYVLSEIVLIGNFFGMDRFRIL